MGNEEDPCRAGIGVVYGRRKHAQHSIRVVVIQAGVGGMPVGVEGKMLVSKHEGNPTYTGNGLHDCRALFDAGEPSYGYEAQDGHAGGRVVDALERRGEHRQDIWANFSGRRVRNARVESGCVLRGVCVCGWAVSRSRRAERRRIPGEGGSKKEREKD